MSIFPQHNQDTTQEKRERDGQHGQHRQQGQLPTPTTPVPKLGEKDREEVDRRVSISAIVVHETVREEGERELQRSLFALACSALAAGLSMGFSMIAKGLINAYLPAGAAWVPLLDNFGYSIGFLIVVLGRQQLFTENTLTVILPLLAHPNLKTLLLVLRLWGIVLFFNLLGAFLFAAFVVYARVFPPTIHTTFVQLAQEATSYSFGVALLKGIFAGWIIALMVWLLPAAENTRLQIIIILTYVIGLGSFAHIIVDSVNVFYLVNLGLMSWSTALCNVLLPTLIGNIIGGVALVAALNYGQVVGEGKKEQNAK